MQENDKININPEFLRKKYVSTGILALLGYFLSQVATVGAKILGLSSITYTEIAVIASLAIVVTITFIFIMSLYKSPTKNFGNVMFYGQYVIFLSMYTVWIYKLNEMRSLGLVCALIAVTFVVFYTTVGKSLFMSMGTTIIQIAVSYYAIKIKGQTGSFVTEVFYAINFIPSFLFISVVAGRLYNATWEIEQSRNRLERINSDLIQAGAEIELAAQKDRKELELASHLQSLLLPKSPVTACGWDIAFSFKPQHGVSGDFYDFYMKGGNFCGLAMFDVSGHGLSAGLITMIAKPIFARNFLSMKPNDHLAKVIEDSNREIEVEIHNTHLMLTGMMLKIDGSMIEYVNAGHHELYRKRCTTCEVTTIGSGMDNFKGNPISLYFDSKYKSLIFPVSEGDSLLLFTDCIIESRDEDKFNYGEKRLISSFREAPDGSADDILKFILDKFYSSVDEKDIVDDFTVIVLKKTDPSLSPQKITLTDFST